MEERLQDLIWKHFIGRPLTEEEKHTIFEIDDQMLSIEFHQLMPEEEGTGYNKLISDVRCGFRSPDIVKEMFLEIYRDWEHL